MEYLIQILSPAAAPVMAAPLAEATPPPSPTAAAAATFVRPPAVRGVLNRKLCFPKKNVRPPENRRSLLPLLVTETPTTSLVPATLMIAAYQPAN